MKAWPLILGVAAMLPSTIAAAQSTMADMPGMAMPTQATAKGVVEKTPPAAEPADPHAGHDMSTMPGMDMSDTTPAADAVQGGTAQPAGDAAAPAPPTDHYADRIYPPATMAAARAALTNEHGGGRFAQILFNLAEIQVHDGANGYRWDGEFWYGGDIDRLVVKSEGEGAFGQSLGSGEVQALYSRAIDPYWNLQAGVRHDFQPDPPLTYATIGVEGLAPYWFETEAALFLSTGGDLLGRLEGYYDQRLTQRLILQPRVELNLSAQDMPAQGIGAGLSNAELGLRLRYEIAREFAPYIGISFDGKTGATARYARDRGEAPTSTSLVIGIRTWF